VLANALCGEPPVVKVQPGSLLTPRVNAISLIVTCKVGFAAGRLLGLPAIDMGVTATAAIGYQDANGDLTDVPNDQPLVARLVP
jgi:hypothetical protein